MQKTFALQYENYEKEHWWFRARRNILRDQILALKLPDAATILEIGVGPGENLYSLYPENTNLLGIEPDPNLIKVARARGAVPVFQATAEQLPAEIPKNSCNAITMFDILEHTEDDVFVLKQVKEKIKPGGLLILSVPAFMMLWGQQDEINLHYRRYTRKNLRKALKEAGFELERTTYFNTILFPLVALFRIANRLFTKQSKESKSDFAYSLGIGDTLLFLLFASEQWLLRFMNFPAGVSLYCVARKPGKTVS